MEISNTQLYREIVEQPSILQNICSHYRETILPIAKALQGKFNSLIIAARGSSDNAARYAQYLFGIQNRIHVSLAAPSLFSLYKTRPILNNALVIGISQSGQSPDICSVLETYRQMGLPTLALTNDVQSPLARICEYLIPLQAHPEESVAATKSYTASLFCLILFSLALNNTSTLPVYIKKIPEQVERQISKFNISNSNLPFFSTNSSGVVLGRGFNYSTAFEISLKIKELSRLRVEAYSSADFRHGPISLIKKGDIALLIGIRGPASLDLIDLARLLQKRAAIIMCIGNIPPIAKLSAYSFPVDSEIPEWISPLITVISGQQLAVKIANDLGLDIDHPFDLNKITQTI